MNPFRFLLLLLLLLPLAACAGVATDRPAKRIALTFDDVPRGTGAFFTPDARTERLIAELKRTGVAQAAFYVNPCNLGRDSGEGGEARIAAYVAAGHVIANHSCSHPRLSTTPVDTYLADIDQAGAWLKGRPGYRAWFRFPFHDEGGKDKAKRQISRGTQP